MELDVGFFRYYWLINSFPGFPALNIDIRGVGAGREGF